MTPDVVSPIRGTQDKGHPAGPERLSLVSELVLRQVPYRTIAAQLGISPSQVGRDVQAVRAAWRARAFDTYEEHVSEQLAMLDMLERVVVREMDKQNNIATRLAAVDSLVRLRDRRARLLGLDKPVKVEHKVEVTSEAAHAVVDELAQRRLSA